MAKKESPTLAGTFFKSYAFSLILIGSIALGSLLGYVLGKRGMALKPLGDLFLNLLFTVVVPMVFFSLSSAVAVMTDAKRLGRILGWMMVIFLATGVVASVLMVAGVLAWPPTAGVNLTPPTAASIDRPDVLTQIVKAFSVSDFGEVLSKRNMLALIVFSILVGLATSAVGEKGKPFAQLLLAGNAVMSKALSYIMYYAPIGLGAYFAYLVGWFGSEMFKPYLRVIALYYPIALLYFGVAFSLYAGLAGGLSGIRRLWSNIIPPALTAWATGSSVATIPTNLAAAEKIGVPADIREAVIPIGATIHMEGSCLAAVLKTSVLFGLYHMNFSDPAVLIQVVGVALLSGVVISGIPSGGMIGELLIINLFGFPIEAMPIITMIGTVVDPPATMVNAVGDNVSSMMIARILEGRDWMKTKLTGTVTTAVQPPAMR